MEVKHTVADVVGVHIILLVITDVNYILRQLMRLDLFFFLSHMVILVDIILVGLTQSHDRHSSSDTLPVVCTDENATTCLHALPLNTRQGRSHQSPMQSTSNQKAPTTSSKTQRINSLSISGMLLMIQ